MWYTQLGFGTNLRKNNILDQNWRGCGPGEHPKKLGPLRIFATVAASNFKFGTQIGFGLAYQKTTFRTEISGGLARGTHKKIWTDTRAAWLRLCIASREKTD